MAKKKQPETTAEPAAPAFKPYAAKVQLPTRPSLTTGTVIAERDPAEAEHPVLFLFNDGVEHRHWIKKDWIQE